MGQVASFFGTETVVSGSQRDDWRKLEFADACLVKANNARDLGDYLGSLGWLEQSLLVRAEVLGAALAVNYNHAYIANLIALGETHLSLRRFDQALVYFLRAKSVLDPLVLMPSTRHTSAGTQYVNLTAGLALVLTAVAKNHHKPTYTLLEGAEPLRVAEQMLEQAVIRVVALEGSRAALLVSLYHILARVYLMTNKRMAALRLMQRCLGLTLHISQTKKIYSFLSYTRNVLDTIKELTLVERVVIKIQQWYRDKIAARQAELMKESLNGFQVTIDEFRDAVENNSDDDDDEENNGNDNEQNNNNNNNSEIRITGTDGVSSLNPEEAERQQTETRKKTILKKFASTVRRMSDAAMVANFFAASLPSQQERAERSMNASTMSQSHVQQMQQQQNASMIRNKNNDNNENNGFTADNNNNSSPTKKYDKERKNQHFSMMVQHQQTMSQDRSHLVSPVLMHASMMSDLGPAAASSYAASERSPLPRKRSSTFSRAPSHITSLNIPSLGQSRNNNNDQENNSRRANNRNDNQRLSSNTGSGTFHNNNNNNTVSADDAFGPRVDSVSATFVPPSISSTSVPKISPENSPFAKLNAFKNKTMSSSSVSPPRHDTQNNDDDEDSAALLPHAIRERPNQKQYTNNNNDDDDNSHQPAPLQRANTQRKPPEDNNRQDNSRFGEGNKSQNRHHYDDNDKDEDEKDKSSTQFGTTFSQQEDNNNTAGDSTLNNTTNNNNIINTALPKPSAQPDHPTTNDDNLSLSGTHHSSVNSNTNTGRRPGSATSGGVVINSNNNNKQRNTIASSSMNDSIHRPLSAHSTGLPPRSPNNRLPSAGGQRNKNSNNNSAQQQQQHQQGRFSSVDDVVETLPTKTEHHEFDDTK